MDTPFRNQPRHAPEELLRRSAAGDETAFRRLYDLEAPRLKALAMRITRSAALAEDVLHDTFLRVWDEAARYDPARGTVQGWLTMLVRFRAMEIVRRHGRELTGLAPPEPPDDAPDPLARLLDSADGRALHACLSQLEPLRQTLIRRAFIDGLTHGELAAETGVPLGTVKSMIRRSLASLKRCLEP